MKTSKQIYSMKMVIGFLGIFFITLAGQAQNKLIVSGVVTDMESGSLLPGVNVLVKNTQRGTMTDFDGKYTVEASVGEVLVFSYLGFNTLEIVVDQKTKINVAMTINNEQLDEVVITALGIKKEVKSLGYSVTEFDGDKMVKARETNPISTLTGKVAGLDIREGI